MRLKVSKHGGSLVSEILFKKIVSRDGDFFVNSF
jgi:hypothetical protein